MVIWLPGVWVAFGGHGYGLRVCCCLFTGGLMFCGWLCLLIVLDGVAAVYLWVCLRFGMVCGGLLLFAWFVLRLSVYMY